MSVNKTTESSKRGTAKNLSYEPPYALISGNGVNIKTVVDYILEETGSFKWVLSLIEQGALLSESRIEKRRVFDHLGRES